MKRVLVASLMVAGVVAASVSPAAAQDYKTKWFVSALYVSPTSDENVDIGGLVDRIEAAEEFGWNVGFEYRFNKLFGLEIDYAMANHDVEFGGTAIGDVDLRPLSLTANFHLIHTEILDFWVGPTYSYIDWSNISLNSTGQGALGVSSVPTDSENAFGATVGLDIGVGERFAVTTALRYLSAEVAPEGDSGLGVDPLMVRAGVAFRFGNR